MSTKDMHALYDAAIFELLKFLNLTGHAESRRREEYEMSWEDLASTWSDRYTHTVAAIGNATSNTDKNDIVRAYNLLIACFGAVKESTPPAYIQRITAHKVAYDPLRQSAAKRHGLDRVAELVGNEATWTHLNEVVHAVDANRGASAAGDVSAAASDSVDDTDRRVSGDDGIADSAGSPAEGTLLRSSTTVDKSDDAADDGVVDPLAGDIVDGAPVVPAIDDKQARIADKQSRHREFVKREFAKFNRGDIDADHMWAATSGGSMEENTGGELMRVQAEDSLSAKGVTMVRVNKDLIERAEDIITERLRQRGFVVSSRRGTLSRSMLLNVMLLDVIGDGVEIELSQGEALVRAALGASDRRADELQEQVGDLGDRLDELNREIRHANVRSARVHEEVLINQNLSAISLGDHLSTVVRPGAGVNGVNIEEPFVRDLVDRVREETRQFIERQREQENRQDSTNIR